MRIMILDDENIIVQGLLLYIESFHIPHCCAQGFTNADEALREVQSCDLAIVDINMPQMDGLEFISRARAVNQNCRFVILSGYSNFAFAQKAIRLGVTDYLIKPVDIEELRKTITSLFYKIYHISPQDAAKLPYDNGGEGERRYSKHMAQILGYISEHFGEDVSTTKLSEITGLHPNYISALFLKEMNTNFHKYLDDFRLMQAKRMLLDNPEMTMGEIAQALGYSNERQFFRMFKQLTGQTPGSYRRHDITGK